MDPEKFAHRGGHGVHVAGGTGYRLGQHLATDVENACGQITCLADHGRERRPHQSLSLFLDDRQKPIPDQLPMKITQFSRHDPTPCRNRR